ncbi:MAG: beta-galactosidase [Lachnospiraceae bacterium]|nr:beta-galactosidase [Lachnospiraceae bacterium]
MALRTEHPKPQFRRETWMNLNGTWEFEIDNSRSGLARGLNREDAALSESIEVPFCPESRLSGIEYKDFILGAWYRKEVTIPETALRGRTVLHFGAVDYECIVYINGKEAGFHKGGYVSFGLDITGYVRSGKNIITVFVRDDTRDGMIPSGKQCQEYASKGCYYTRTTGIWQTVWLEFTPDVCIKSANYRADIENGIIIADISLEGTADLKIQAFFGGRKAGEANAANASGNITLAVTLSEVHLWDIGRGCLYDLVLSFGDDKVYSYYGLRSICMKNSAFLLNGRPVFQRLILDQGFYPDGIYTAPDDADLAADIDLAMDMGFNGARAHEKIFEERWLYYCDMKGYMVWGEYPNWGLDHSRSDAIYSILPEWIEEIARDRNHPCIIGWCPFNETWNKCRRPQYDDLIRQVYRVTKAIDPSRPCIDTSGFFHVETDIYDVHDYEQDPEEFRRRYDLLATEGQLYEIFDPPQSQGHCYEERQHYEGQPVFISEFGGIRWAPGEKKDSKSWGYGKDVHDAEDFINRFDGLTKALLDNKKIFGFCYTQLTDVEQEQNGLYTYQRKPKFDIEQIRNLVARKAAIEE